MRTEEAPSTGSWSTGSSKPIMQEREEGRNKVNQKPQTKAKSEYKGAHVTKREGEGKSKGIKHPQGRDKHDQRRQQ